MTLKEDFQRAIASSQKGKEIATGIHGRKPPINFMDLDNATLEIISELWVGKRLAVYNAFKKKEQLLEVKKIWINRGMWWIQFASRGGVNFGLFPAAMQELYDVGKVVYQTEDSPYIRVPDEVYK